MLEIYINGTSKNDNINSTNHRARICVVVPSEDINTIVQIGDKTNNQAEWKALIEALRMSQQQNWMSLKIYSDSELIVEQFHDRRDIKNVDLLSSYLVAKTLAGLFDKIDLQLISRSQNLAGIELERRG